ncbi:MAG TPA: hypothetical protein VG711_04825, partial [Phycisphaerales bacterium]|nr:hypothetical protein [Phycisphaerales bacterium]
CQMHCAQVRVSNSVHYAVSASLLDSLVDADEAPSGAEIANCFRAVSVCATRDATHPIIHPIGMAANIISNARTRIVVAGLSAAIPLITAIANEHSAQHRITMPGKGDPMVSVCADSIGDDPFGLPVFSLIS